MRLGVNAPLVEREKGEPPRGSYSLAVQNGNVFAWGWNNAGQLGNNSTTDSEVPMEVSFGGSVLSGIVQVAAGPGWLTFWRVYPRMGRVPMTCVPCA